MCKAIEGKYLTKTTVLYMQHVFSKSNRPVIRKSQLKWVSSSLKAQLLEHRLNVVDVYAMNCAELRFFRKYFLFVS